MQPTSNVVQEPDINLRAELRENISRSDVMLILAVPVVLTTIYLLPESARGALVLDHGNPAIFNLWSSSFVHLRFGHLANNIVMYSLTVALVYSLFTVADEQQLFRYIFISFVAVLPPIISLISVVTIGQGDGFGFSGITAAFVGLLPVSLFLFLHNRISAEIYPSHGAVLFLIALSFVAMIYADLFAGIAILLISFVLLLWIIYQVSVDNLREQLALLIAAEDSFLLVILVFLLFLVAPFGLFPADFAQQGVNIISHYAGLMIGFAIPTLFLMIKE